MAMAERFGVIEKSEPPELYAHLWGVVKSVHMARATGWQMCANIPLAEIEVAHRAYGYDGSLDEFIELFRKCEKALNDRRDTERGGNKDRPETSSKGRETGRELTKQGK